MKNLSIYAMPVTERSKDNLKAAHFEQILALISAPFYIIVIPFLVFNHIHENVFFGIFLMILSLGNFLYLFSWIKCNFVFRAERVKLPGVLFRSIPYSRLIKISRNKDYPLIVAVLFKADDCLFRRKKNEENEILRWYSARNEASAKIIWSQFSERLENSATKMMEE